MLSTCIAQNERISVFLNTEIPKSYNVWSGTALPQVGPPCHFKLRPCCLAPPLNETDKTYVVSEEVLWGSSTTSSLWKQHKQTRSIHPLNVGTVSRATMIVIMQPGYWSEVRQSKWKHGALIFRVIAVLHHKIRVHAGDCAIPGPTSNGVGVSAVHYPLYSRKEQEDAHKRKRVFTYIGWTWNTRLLESITCLYYRTQALLFQQHA